VAEAGGSVDEWSLGVEVWESGWWYLAEVVRGEEENIEAYDGWLTM
jgi:hypothetical protein